MLNLNPWNLAFTIINILVLAALIKRFLFKPINAVMEQRKEILDQQIEEIEKQRTEVTAMKGQYEGIIADAKEKNAQIIAEARKNGQDEFDRIVKSANVEARKIIEDAENVAAMEKKKALQSVEAEIATMAVMAAGKILEGQGSAQGNEALYNQFLSKVGEKRDRSNN